MGVIQRQSIKGSIINYIGVAIGATSTLFIYPLNWELYGGIQYWIASAMLLAPLLRQGSTALVNKFYPYFKNRDIQGFLGLIFLITIATILLTTGVIGAIVAMSSNIEPIRQFLNSNDICIIYSLCILTILSSILQLQSANAQRIVIPEIIKKIGLKVTIIAVVLLGYFAQLDLTGAAIFLLIYYLCTIVLLAFYLYKLNHLSIGGLNLKALPKELPRRIFKYWIFGGLNYLGVILAYKIDTFMIGTMLDKVSVGYYSVFLFMANILIIPMTSISQISGPIVSDAFERDGLSKIEEIYKKSASSLLTVGTFLFMIIWLNIFNIVDIMTNGEEILPFISIFLFLGLAKLFDLMTSINNLIIIYSKWYRVNLIFLAIMSMMNMLLNIILIRSYGIVGAAIATTISIFLFNLIKTLFIYFSLKIHPFGRNILYLLVILLLTIITAPIVQKFSTSNSWVSILLISIGVAVVYIPLVYKLRTSEELNKVIRRLLNRIL